MENPKQNFQECSHLLIEDAYSKSSDTLGDLMNLQKSIQENVYGYNFEEIQSSLKNLLEFWKWNSLAINSEMNEAFDALGGIKDGIGNAAWKPWKKDHAKINSMKLSDLSESDLKELKMETVDLQHFLYNLMLSIGMTPEELYNYYIAKNNENINRQKRGY